MRLLTLGNPKTAKGRAYGYHTGVLHLHPDSRICPNASKGCMASCLNTAGRAGIIKKGETTNRILEARKRRTRFMKSEPGAFKSDLLKDVELLQRQAEKLGLKTACRLNGTSDLPWERSIVVHRNPGVQFYDYTKSLTRMRAYMKGELPKNYHLTFSHSERNGKQCMEVLNLSGNVAIVTMSGGWDGDHSLDSFGFPVNGDEHDLTFLHHPGSILVLKAKGRARKDTTGFVLPC